MNIKTHECLLNEQPLVLTPTEFSILQFLLEHKGNVVSSEELFHHIWKNEYYSKKTIQLQFIFAICVKNEG